MNITYYRLIWLMPMAVILHVGEEYLAHFPRYVGEMTGNPMPVAGFLINNVIFWVILVALSVWAVRSRSPIANLLLLAWAAGNLFWNFIFHLALVEKFDRNSPGLLSATLVYLPLSLWVWSAALRQAIVRPARLAAAIALGMPVMGLVIVAGLPR